MDAIEPGLDFVEAIDRALSETEVMLVVVGPKWVDGGESGRLQEAADYVRLEIEAGLRRPDMRVIPVLVGGASMPSAGELPEEIQALVRRNGVEMIDKRWRTDQAQLVVVLERLLGRAEPEAPEQPVEETQTVAAPAQPQAAQVVSAPAVSAADRDWYVKAGWATLALTAIFWFLAPIPIVLGVLTMRKGGERRRRTGVKLIVLGLAIGLLSLTLAATAAWQGWL